MSEERKQLTELLPNKVLNRLERLRVNPLQRRTNKHRGEHLSGRGGTSTEFSDYRDYVPGDDTRFIDWNIYSRLRRPYLKLFQLEEEMRVVIVVDASESMNFEHKLHRAKQLAAAFGIMSLYGTERVSIYVTGEETMSNSSIFPSTHGRANINRLFRFLENIQCNGRQTLDLGIENVMKYHKGKGVAVVLSDFLTFGDLGRMFNSLFSSGLEIYALQILSPTEINPELIDDVRFIDCETEMKLDVSAVGNLVGIYHEHRRNFEHELDRMCKRRAGRFLPVNSGMSIEDIIFNQLLRKGWIK